MTTVALTSANRRSHSRAHSRARSWSHLAMIAGGAAIMIGSALPWMSMFAGLKPMSGLLGLNGWLLLASGLALALTPWLQRRLAWWAGPALIVNGLALGVVCYAGTGLASIVRDVGNALLVPRVGPGLPVAFAGCAMCLIATIVSMTTEDS